MIEFLGAVVSKKFTTRPQTDCCFQANNRPRGKAKKRKHWLLPGRYQKSYTRPCRQVQEDHWEHERDLLPALACLYEQGKNQIRETDTNIKGIAKVVKSVSSSSNYVAVVVVVIAIVIVMKVVDASYFHNP